MNINVTEQSNGIMAISGQLNFKTIPDIWQQSLTILLRGNIQQIDLSAATSTSSAALALIIEYIRYGEKYQKPFKFTGISTQIESIAGASEVKELLNKYR